MTGDTKVKADLIRRDDVLSLVTTEKPQLFDADALYMEIENIRTVDAIPCAYIREKARKSVGAESTYLRKLLKDWEYE